MRTQFTSEKPRFLMFSSASTPVEHCLQVLRSRVFQRIVAAIVSFSVFVVLLLTLVHVNPGGHLPDPPEKLEQIIGQTHRNPNPTCQSVNNTGDDELVKQGLKKYENLRDDKFTMAIQTYRRPKQLERTLKTLLEGDDEIPSLLEVVIVWNDLEQPPPKDYKSRHGVHVRYRQSVKNSLNSRLIPDPTFQTQAILLSDDDVYYQPLDLEFVFQSWRKYGRDRLTGAMARCTRYNELGHLEYVFCHEGRDDRYNMVITNLAFAHVRFLDYYSSDNEIMNKIRAEVDQNMNCEDIAMNFVSQLISGEPPLLVYGDSPYINMNPPGGISMHKGHFERRSKCLDHFSDLFGCFPLLNSNAYLGLGSGRHKWDGYKAPA